MKKQIITILIILAIFVGGIISIIACQEPNHPTTNCTNIPPFNANGGENSGIIQIKQIDKAPLLNEFRMLEEDGDGYFATVYFWDKDGNPITAGTGLAIYTESFEEENLFVAFPALENKDLGIFQNMDDSTLFTYGEPKDDECNIKSVFKNYPAQVPTMKGVESNSQQVNNAVSLSNLKERGNG